MSWYSAIDRRINADEWFRNLEQLEQLLWFRLLTGSHVTAVAGLWPATEEGLARQMKVPVRKFRELFKAFEGKAFADWDAGVLYLPNALRIEPNQPRNEKTLKGWIKPLELVPECTLRDQALADFVAWIQSESKRFPNGVPPGFPRPRQPVSGTVSGTVSDTVSQTVSDTVSQTVSDTVSQTVSDTGADTTRVRAYANQDQDQDQEQQQEPAAAAPVDPTTKVRCPVPVPVPADALANLTMMAGLPALVATGWLLAWAVQQNAKVSDLRTVDAWVSGAVRAVSEEWSKDKAAVRARAAQQTEGDKARSRAAVQEALERANAAAAAKARHVPPDAPTGPLGAAIGRLTGGAP